MKKLLFLLLLPTFLAISCSDKSAPKLFNPQNLRTQHFKIDPRIDTTLFSLRGGIFSIPKGSFEGEGLVNIEIKEAYSPTEIIYAGLATESNGRLLESGGMVYFNAKRNGKQLELLKPVGISVPTNYVSDEMKLFKGEVNSGRSIDWKDPESLDSSINKSSVDSGEILFKTHCASCHTLFKDMTGPALAFTEEMVNDRNVLKAFIRNPEASINENSYFQCQKANYASMMTAFPDLSDREIDLILNYIKNESDKRPDLKPHYVSEEGRLLTKDTSISLCLSAPCGFDTIYVDTSNYKYLAANMMDLHAEAPEDDSLDSFYKEPDSLEKAMRSSGFIDVLPTEGRYNFRIKTLGWFNVDAFYEGMEGTEIVDLFVKTDFEEKEKLEVHVFFPAKRILTVGTFHENDGLFHFEKYKGQIPLFLNDEAVAIGFTSIKEKIYYGITSFKVTKQQTININVQESTKEKLAEAFKKMKLDGIDLDIITKKRLIVPKQCTDELKSDLPK